MPDGQDQRLAFWRLWASKTSFLTMAVRSSIGASASRSSSRAARKRSPSSVSVRIENSFCLVSVIMGCMIAQAHYHVKTPSSRKCDHDGIDSVITHGYIGLIEATGDDTMTTKRRYEVEMQDVNTKRHRLDYVYATNKETAGQLALKRNSHRGALTVVRVDRDTRAYLEPRERFNSRQ